MSRSSYSVLSMKLTKRDSSARMHAVVVMTSMFMSNLVQVLTFVERNQLLLKALRASLVDPD